MHATSPQGPCSCSAPAPFHSGWAFVRRRAIAKQIEDTLGCGEPQVLSPVRQYSEQRFGAQVAEEKSSVYVGMEMSKNSDFSVTEPQEDEASADASGCMPDFSAMWADP